MSLSKSLLTLILLFITLITLTHSQDTTTPPAKNIIGIDLGTTYSVVAIYRGGKVEIIPNKQGHRTTPSVVSYNQDGERLVGEAAKNNGPVNPKNTIYDVKRLIGRRYKEVLKKDSKLLSYRLVNQEGKVGIKVQRTEASPEEILSPEQVSAQILTQMKTTAEEYLGEEVTHAVITVPAYFNDQQRQATKDAGRIAGLNVVRIINEPTAASMAYGLDKEKEENILVFDLGGGTFDVTLLTIDHGVFEVIATSGDTHLGGEDFDLRIVEYMASLFKKKTGLDIMKDRRAFQRLKRACEDAKRALSSEVETRLEIDNIMNGKDFSEKLTRAKFEQLNMDLFKKTMNPVKQVLKDGGLNKNEVDEIVLVGGSTRIPKIRELLQQFFRGKPLHIDVNPDEAIAYGAAVQAAVIEGTMKQNVILIDVAPLSLGIETMGGRMSVIIPRNTPIPADKADTFTTTHDYQDRLVIPIYEGERPMTKFNRLLGEMELTGIQPAPKGVPQIKVSFQLDQNGILKVMAIDEATKKKNEITIQKGNPSQDEIEKMIEDAKKHEREDKDFVEGQKARNKLTEFTQFINKKMGEKEIKYKLKSGDRNNVVNAIKATMKFLRTVDAGTRKSEITREYRKLRNVVAPLLFGENGLISEDELRWDEEFDIESSSDQHWNDDSKEETSQDDSNIDDLDQWNDDEQPISEAENVSEDESSIEVEEPKKDEL